MSAKQMKTLRGFTIGVAAVALMLALGQTAPAALVQSGNVGTALNPIYAFKSEDRTTATGSWTAPAGITSIEIMVVGGGGGGAKGEAGAGGGGFVSYDAALTVVPGTSYAITIGGGGGPSTDGSPSSFGALLTAAGGGGGNNPAIWGGYPCRIGGDSGYNATTYSGGSGHADNTGHGTFYAGGGGAGASAPGGAADTVQAGDGGDGLYLTDALLFGASFSPSGAFIPDAVGGGGGGSAGPSGVPHGSGGLGGGGSAEWQYHAYPGENGTGGGGGDGGAYNSAWEGPGGSGIIVLTYVPEPATMALLGLGGLGLLLRRKSR